MRSNCCQENTHSFNDININGEPNIETFLCSTCLGWGDVIFAPFHIFQDVFHTEIDVN